MHLSDAREDKTTGQGKGRRRSGDSSSCIDIPERVVHSPSRMSGRETLRETAAGMASHLAGNGGGHSHSHSRSLSCADVDEDEGTGLLWGGIGAEASDGPAGGSSARAERRAPLGNGWMVVSGMLIGRGIRVVTDIEGRELSGRPFSWRADAGTLHARAELPDPCGCLPEGPMRQVAFHMAVGYIIGSILFVFGAAASLSNSVSRSETLLFRLVDLPYFFGAWIFQIANYFAMVEPLNEDLGFRQYLWERSALGGQAPKGRPPPVPPPRTRWLGASARLPFLGGLFYFLGGLFFCVMTTVPVVAENPSDLAETLAVDTMAVLGGLGFVTGAWCYCFEYGIQLSKLDPNAYASAGPMLWFLCAGVCPIAGAHELSNVGFLINGCNMLGSLGFCLSGFFYFAKPGSVARVLVQGETFFGYFLGSVLFLIGSILLLAEVYAPESRTHRRFEEMRRLPEQGNGGQKGSSAAALLRAAGAAFDDLPFDNGGSGNGNDREVEMAVMKPQEMMSSGSARG